MDLKEIGSEGVDKIDLVQDRDHWQALLSIVMNFQVTEQGISDSEQLSASQVGLRSMDLISSLQ
jgi:hypothetical protein